MTFIIRPATVSDAAAICEIYNPYVLNTNISFETAVVTAREMALRITEVTAFFPWLVCVESGDHGDVIRGYAYATKWRARAAYAQAVESSVYLSDTFAGKGLGSMLYRALLDVLAKLPVHTVIGGIALPNAGSVALHEKMGFQKVGVFREVGIKSDAWIDVGYWQLILP
ncbi:arsinothricin resistance N-acetyltransferase ArsN1 family B [Glaciimonas sp. PAMC28666]|uniref:arsinothricin resistance N-acetyltransferase ArsN1 family B n=1 Tax=Glaciimonas sp. PAMC28666 TaxID=2807626 RepID=UPI0019623750|nr:arsinothricin resistance N-acetyltransferase ArsN1 family B [Glaciimonas sp. PAMC28666]QRX84785.1 N-acetyltransferase [Glaciimonas sp. PAMC28666]